MFLFTWGSDQFRQNCASPTAKVLIRGTPSEWSWDIWQFGDRFILNCDRTGRSWWNRFSFIIRSSKTQTCLCISAGNWQMMEKSNSQYDSFLFWRQPIPALDLSELEDLGLTDRCQWGKDETSKLRSEDEEVRGQLTDPVFNCWSD